jgi:hypothetical protein
MSTKFAGPPDLILHNARIVTADPTDTIAEAVSVRQDRILRVGSSTEIMTERADKTEVIDLGGRTVIPGLMDAHVHIDCTAAHTKLASSAHIPPVEYIETRGRVENKEDILAALRRRVKETPKGEWIFAQGRFSLANNGHSPSKSELDAIAPEHPIMLRYSAHAHFLNSKALEMAEIGRSYPSQKELERLAPGGKILRDPETWEPTGKMLECGDWIFPKRSPFSYDELREAIRQTCHEAASYGVTSVQEFTSWPESVAIYQDLARNGELPLRVQLCPCVWGMYQTIDVDSLVDLRLQTGFGNDQLRFGQIKLFTDVEGENDRGEFVEWPRISQEKLNEIVHKAFSARIGVMMHATSRQGQEMAMNAVELASEAFPDFDHRSRIEHFGGFYWPEGLARMKSLGMIPVPTPYSSLSWFGDAWLDAHKPGDKTVIYRTLLEEGFTPPGNSDCMGTEPEALNPWWSIWCAVARETRSGRSICPEEGITVDEAIRLYTNHSAYACFQEDGKGAIEPGKLADMVVLADDPLSVPIEDLPEVKVDMTFLGGDKVFDRNH